MDFNILLFRLGLDPANFVNKEIVPVKTEEGFLYEAEQKTDNRICPHCRSKNVVINDYDWIEINCSETDQIRDTLRIRKVRFKCRDCNKTFTPPLSGIERYARTSLHTINMIVKDFFKKMTFRDIGERYGITSARVIQIFDEKIPCVPRRNMPFVLCIDEIRFHEEIDQKYCCVLYDFEKKEIVDIIKNRQLAYLEEYFVKEVKERERNNVRYFVSDMYDGYRTIRKKYFKNALHIIDLFHVITQMSRAVNQLRVRAMKKIEEDSNEYRYMKSHWKNFLCRKENIPDKFYTSRKTGEIFHYDDLLYRCVLKDKDLLEGYNILQDLYHYNQKQYTFSEALLFVESFAERLTSTGNEILSSVGYTYRKWVVEIANGLAKSQTGKHYANGIAENINNHLKTIIKLSYGYHNFERFRKRAMMIVTYRKDLEN